MRYWDLWSTFTTENCFTSGWQLALTASANLQNFFFKKKQHLKLCKALKCRWIQFSLIHLFCSVLICITSLALIRKPHRGLIYRSPHFNLLFTPTNLKSRWSKEKSLSGYWRAPLASSVIPGSSSESAAYKRDSCLPVMSPMAAHVNVWTGNSQCNTGGGGVNWPQITHLFITIHCFLRLGYQKGGGGEEEHQHQILPMWELWSQLPLQGASLHAIGKCTFSAQFCLKQILLEKENKDLSNNIQKQRCPQAANRQVWHITSKQATLGWYSQRNYGIKNSPNKRQGEE